MVCVSCVVSVSVLRVHGWQQATMDLRRAAMASFAVIAVGAGAVWYRSTKALSKKDTTAPSVAKKTLIAVLEDLHAAAEDASVRCFAQFCVCVCWCVSQCCH